MALKPLLARCLSLRYCCHISRLQPLFNKPDLITPPAWVGDLRQLYLFLGCSCHWRGFPSVACERRAEKLSGTPFPCKNFKATTLALPLRPVPTLDIPVAPSITPQRNTFWMLAN